MKTKLAVAVIASLCLNGALFQSKAAQVSGTLSTNTTWSDTSSEYLIDNFVGPLVVPAGITLTVSTGVTVRVKYSNKSGMEVRGTVVADGANLNFRTSTSTAGGKTAMRVLDNGVLALTNCQVAAVHDSLFIEDSRLIEAAGASRLTLSGTRFTTGGTGTAVGNAMLVSGTATLECFNSPAGGSNSFTGFRRSVQVSSTNAAVVSSTSFDGYLTALEATGGSVTVSNCSFTSGTNSQAITFTPDGRNLSLESSRFTGGTRGVVFDAQGGNLSMDSCTFTGAVVAVEALAVNTLTFNNSAIAGNATTKGLTGLHTELMTAFVAVNSAISRQQRGIYVQHVNRSIDVSGIQFTDNDYNVYAGGVFTMPATITTNTVLPAGSYLINNTAQEITIAAGVTLGFEPGTVVSNQSAVQNLFKVKGRLMAEAVRFELQSQNGKGGIVVAEDGVAELSSCILFASARNSSTNAIITALDRSTVAATSCQFETDARNGYPVQSGLALQADSQGILSGTAELPSTLRGFPIAVDAQSRLDFMVWNTTWQSNTTALKFKSDANLLLDACILRDNQTALRIDQIGVWSVQGVMLERNVRGLDFASQWAATALDQAGFSFANNTYDRYVRTGGTTLGVNVTMAPGSYAVDCTGTDYTGSPLKIAAGATLTLVPGTTLRTIDSGTGAYYADTYQLFQVEGTLVAQEATFELRTMSHATYTQNESRSITVVGDGVVQMSECTLRTGDRVRQFEGSSGYHGQQGRVFEVRGRGSLLLAGCTLSTAESSISGDATWRTGYGIVASESGTVVLGASGGQPTVIQDFLLVDLSLQGDASANLAAVVLSGSRAGLTYASSQTPALGNATIRNCSLGIDYGVNWAGTRLNTAVIVFSNNTYDRYVRTGGTALGVNVTMVPGSYVVDCKGTDYTGSPLKIAAGATLTIGPGTTLRTIDSGTGSYYADTYQLFQVEGTLMAQGATFELRTMSEATQLQNQSRSITVVGDGAVQMSECTLRAGDRLRQYDGNTGSHGRSGRVFEVRGRGSLWLAGCTLSTAESTVSGDATWRTGYGIVVSENGSVVLEASGGQPTVIQDFLLVDLSLQGDASANLTAATLSGSTSGLSHGSSQTLLVGSATIRNCVRGADYGANWAGTRLNTAAIVFSNNTYDRYVRTGGATLGVNVTMAPGSYVVDCTGTDYTGSPLKIAAGATLTIGPGTTLRTIDSGTGAYYADTYKLFQVEGTLVAQGATFELRTMSYANYPQNESRSITVVGDGSVQMSECTLRAGDRLRQYNSDPGNDYRNGRVIEVRGQGNLRLAGCTLSTAESTVSGDATWRTGYGIVVSESGSVVLEASGGQPTVIQDFLLVDLSLQGDASANLTAVTLSGSTSGLSHGSSQTPAVGSLTIRNCVRGVDHNVNWAGTRLETAAIVFSNNTYDRYVRTGGTTLGVNVTMAPGSYAVDCTGTDYTGSPLKIAAGATLTIGPGTTLRTIDSGTGAYYADTYQLFQVEGTLVAQGATFELRTMSYANYPQNESRSITVVGDGAVQMSECTLRAGDRLRHYNSDPGNDYRNGRVIEVRGQGNLRLAGCTLSTAESTVSGDATWRTGYGIVVYENGSVALEASGGQPTVIQDFASAGLFLSAEASADLAAVVLSGSTSGLAYRSNPALTLGNVTIRNCVRGVDYNVNWAGTRLNTAAIVFSNNTYDRYVRTGGTTLGADLTMAPGSYAVDCTGTDDTGSPLKIAVGATLTIGPGTTLRTIDTGTGPYYRDTYQLFQVEGTLVAQGATFELRTMSYANYPQNESRSITVVGDGVVQMSECTLRAGDRARQFNTNPDYDDRNGRVIEVRDRGSLRLAGCALSTAESTVSGDATWRTGYGIVVGESARVTLEASADQPTVIQDFASVGLFLAAEASVDLVAVVLSGSPSGLSYGSSQTPVLGTVTIRNCGRGVDYGMNWVGTRLNTVGIVFSNNTYDRYVRTGGATLAGDLTMAPGSYVVDCKGTDYTGSPLKIAVGATLTVVPGTTLRTIDSGTGWYYADTYQLFQVEGTLVAQGATFELRTMSHANYPQNESRSITVVGDGTVQMSECTLRAGDRMRYHSSKQEYDGRNGRVFEVRGQGHLLLAACTVSTAESTVSGDATWRTGYGIVALDSSNVRLESINGHPTAVDGFAQTGVDVRGTTSLNLKGVEILNCEVGLYYLALAPVSIVETRIVNCARGLEQNGVLIGLDTRGLTFVNNTIDRRVQGGFTVSQSLILPQGVYDFDCNTGPVVIAPGARLTFSEGSSISSYDPTPDDNYQLFVVEGELQARSCEFRLRTRSPQGAAAIKSILLRGTGRGELASCRLVTSDSAGTRLSGMFFVEDAASLRMDQCELFSTEEDGYRTYGGIVHNSTGSLLLTDSSFLGFAVALQASKIPNDYLIERNQFLGNTTYAVSNSATNDLDCTDNWWGHPTGPRHRTNPLALGDPVSDHVLFVPYVVEGDFPLILLSEHAVGQATNAFTGVAGATNAVVFRFGLRNATGHQVSRLILELLDVEGLDAADWQRLRLVDDTDADGAYEAGTDPVLAAGVLTWTNQTITFTGELPGNGDFLVLADLPDIPSGAAAKLRLTLFGVSVDLGTFVLGAVRDAIHYRDRVLLADHGAVSYADALSAQETQVGVSLTGFTLSPGCTVRQFRFDLTELAGLEPIQFQELELVTDVNGDGVAGADEPRLGGGSVAITGTTGTITFDASSQPVVSGISYLLRCTLSRLRAGDALTVSLTKAGITAVEPGTVLSGSVHSARHVVDSPLFVLDAAFQVKNQFIEAEQLPRIPLLGFTFVPPGRTIQSLVFRLTDVSGIGAWEVTNVRLYRDDNRNGVLEARETVTVGGPGLVTIDPESYSGTIRFSVPFAAQGTYLLAGDFAHLDKDDSMTVELQSSDVDAGAGAVVDGGVSPVQHIVLRPDLAASPLQQNWTLTWRSPGGLQVCGGYSRDGNKAVIGYDSGAAYVYDLKSGVPERMLMRHYDRVQYAGFSGDDSEIITVTRDGGVYVWHAASGELKRMLFADVLVRYAVASPDFTRLLVVTQGRAFLLSLLDERQLWEFTVGSDFYSVDFSPDGSRVLLGCADKRAYVLDAQTGEIPKVYKGGIQYDLIFQGHHDTVHGVAFTANGTRIMTASRDATATLWNADDPVNPIATISLNGQLCDSAFVNRTGDRVALVTNNRYLRLFDDEGLELYSYDMPRSRYTGAMGFAVFSDEGAEFMLGSNHTNLSNSGSVVARFRTSDHALLDTVGPLGLVSANVKSPVRISEDGHRVFFTKHNGLEVLQRRTGVPIRRYTDLNSSHPYDITPDGTKLAWASTYDSSRSLLNLAVVDDDRLTPVASYLVSQVLAPLSISRSGGLVVISDKIYRTASGDLFADSPNTDAAYTNAFSPDNELWGITVGNSIKTMRTTDASGSLEYGVTLTGSYQPMKILYHPNGVYVGCVFSGGVQFYRLDNNDPYGLYDNRGSGLQDAVLSHDGSMLLVARANSVRLYDMRTGRPLRYFYPLHSGQSTCLVRSIAFGAHDDIVMIAWSDNYVETYERSRLVALEIAPASRTLPPTTTQEFQVEAIYDDGSRQNVSPRSSRAGGLSSAGAQLYADPPEMVEIVENRVTLNAQATGTITLTAVYSEGGVVRSATSTITVGPCPLASLTPVVPEITLTHGVVLPVQFTATYADGYQEVVTPELTVDAPEHVIIAGNNITVLRSAGTRTITVTATFTSRGVTRTATMQIRTYGPQSNWVRSQVTSGGDIYSMDYRSDGRQLAVGGSSGTVSLYSVGVSPTAYELDAVVPAHERPIRHLFYLNTNQFVTVGEDGWIRTWALADTRQPLREFAHDAVITCASYYQGWLAFGDNLGRVNALVLDQNRLVWSFQVHDKTVRGVAIDGDSVFSGGDDRKAVLTRRTDGTQLRAYSGYSEPVMAVGIRNGMTFTISEDRRLVEWKKGTVDENIWEYFLPGIPSAIRQTSDRLYVTVGSAQTSMEEFETVVTGYRSTTWVYDTNGLLLHQMEHSPYEGRIAALAVSPGGEFLLTGRSTALVQSKNELTGETELSHFPFHSVQFWSATRASYRGSLDHNRSIESARITRDGLWLYTQSPERIFRWRLGTNLARSKFLETGYDIPYRFNDLRMSDDATGLIVTRVGETMYLMDGVARLLRMSVHHQGCSTFDISPDGQRLISYGNNLRLWDVAVDFPTVLYEVQEKRAQSLAFFPSCLPERQGDWLAGLNDANFGNDAETPWEPFLAILNNRGLQFSGITLPLDSSGGIVGAQVTPTVAISRNQSRCAVVAQPVAPDGLGGLKALDLAYIYVLDLCTPDEGISPRVLRMVECNALGAKVAVALSDDGTLLFYGGTPADDQGVAPGSLMDVNTGRLLYSFAPPSMGSVANRGPSAAQFTQNDGALMIAWGEGYSSIYVRQGLDRIEITPLVKTVAPGEAVPLQATAVYVDGSRTDVTREALWSLDPTPHASLDGSTVVLNNSIPTNTTVQARAVFEGINATREATSTLTVRAPQFIELIADPLRSTVLPGSEVTFRYFARMADGSSHEVTGLTTVTANPAERVEVNLNRVRVPAFTQAGYVQIEARCVQDGDERTVTSVLLIRDPQAPGNPGDFDGDDRVAYPDVLYFVGHYGERPTSPKWDARCDFNGNQLIDFTDVLALVALYGKTYGDQESQAMPKAVDSGPLVQFRIEGPTQPVAVGETFDLRIYARETSAAANGITGILLDLLLDPERVSVALPFDANSAVAPPYNSILTHGSVAESCVDELGGACVAAGWGDGSDVLFATLRFTASRAGTATFRLATGEAGIALTQPVGLVSTNQVDYGAACDVSISDGGFSGQIEIANASLGQILRYGARADANAGFDSKDGDAPGLPPGGQGEGAWLKLDDRLLASDVRPVSLRQVWQLQLIVPPGATGDAAWNLSWAGTEAPAGTALMLVPADADWSPVEGLRLSLRKPGSLSIANDGSDSQTVRFLIVWDQTVTQTWRLEPGWNLVGCALEPDEETTTAVLQNPGLRAILKWTPGWGYSIPEALDSRTGYLVYTDTQREIPLAGLPILPGACPLLEGWNLVSEHVRVSRSNDIGAPPDGAGSPSALQGVTTATGAGQTRTAAWIYVKPTTAQSPAGGAQQ